MSHRVGVTVLVDDDHLDRMAEVVAGLRDAGLQVTAVHDALGTLAGESEETALPALRAVAGVAAVEHDRAVRIPPPEADTQ